jgi:hypothetical protein
MEILPSADRLCVSLLTESMDSAEKVIEEHVKTIQYISKKLCVGG